MDEIELRSPTELPAPVVDTDRPPTSSLVRVAGLVRPDFLIEIEAVAAVAEDPPAVTARR